MSSKRPASEMSDYDGDGAPNAKKFKSSNVQIVATNEEIDDRINMLIASKKNGGGSTQVSAQIQADSLRIADAMDKAKANTKPHHTRGETDTQNVTESLGPTAHEHVVQLTAHLPEGLPNVIEERLSSLERRIYSNISVRAVPRDIYGRLKALEERVIALERAGVLKSKTIEVPSGGSEVIVPSTISAAVPAEVDGRIKELQEKLLAQAAQQ